MNRPSHWMLAAVATLGLTLVASGSLQGWLAGAPPAPEPEQPAQVAVASAPADAPRDVARRPAAFAVAVEHHLHGQVVDRLGWPVERARVTGRGGERVETDALGRFELNWRGPLIGLLRVEAPGRHAPAQVLTSIDEMHIVLQDAVPWRESGPRPEQVDADLGLVGEGFLRHEDGSRYSGGRVRVPENGALAIADDTGRYVLPLHQGPVSLVAWDPAGLIATLPTLEPSRAQGKIPLPDLVLLPGLRMRGRLVDPNGAPLADASVQVENAGSERVARTDAAGQFVVEGLAPVETAITVVPMRGLLGIRRSAVLADDLDLGDLPLERPRQDPLRLRVVDGQDEPLPWVHVVADQEDGLSRAYAQADDSGRVSIGGLGSGAVAFEVRSTDLAPMQISDFDIASRTLIVSR